MELEKAVFGYVRVFKPQMKVCEFETYNAVYCTLCRELGRQYGVFSRLLLNYDYTFVTLLYMALHKQSPEYKKAACVFNPLKRCGKCTCSREGFSLTCAMTAEMLYYKLTDNIADSGAISGLGWRAARLIAAPMRRKAKKRYPAIDELTARCIAEQQSAEKDPCASIDSAAEPSAKLISSLAELLSEDETDRRVLRDFGYYLGRWIYLIDAFDDIDKDIKENAFNPFAKKFGLEAKDVKENSERLNEARLYANECLNMTVARSIAAFGLLDTGVYEPIFDNILRLGLGEAQRKALYKKELQQK